MSLFSVISSHLPDRHRLAFGMGLVSREVPAGFEVASPRKSASAPGPLDLLVEGGDFSKLSSERNWSLEPL